MNPREPICNIQYHVPQTLDEALALLQAYGSDAKILAGGTDLIPKMKAGVAKFTHMVSLKAISQLKKTYFDAQGNLHIGATTPLRELEAIAGVKEQFPALWMGMHSMANTQIRNRGTVVGNICNAVPSADTAPALLVYEAQVVIASQEGSRTVPIDAFFTGVCRTVLAPQELVTEVILPRQPEGYRSVYYKYAIRNALDLAMVGVAANVKVENGTVADARIALGAVAVTPKRAAAAEALVLGKPMTQALAQEAGQVASRMDCAPISDIRASADYRREMVRIHVRDALLHCAAPEEGGAQQ